jgi:hypothetical protein
MRLSQQPIEKKKIALCPGLLRSYAERVKDRRTRLEAKRVLG